MQRCAICVQSLANFAHKQGKKHINTLQNNVLGMYKSIGILPPEASPTPPVPFRANWRGAACYASSGKTRTAPLSADEANRA
jgi:hypothetical protein